MAKVKKFYVESELVFEEKPKNSEFLDLTGQRFWMLFVLGYAGNRKWFCRCDCGNIVMSASYKFKSGHTKSCGCYRSQSLAAIKTKHGHSKRGYMSKTYISWRSMISRCKNEYDNNYHNYGGRGIKVCDRWVEFENFLEDMGESPKDLSLDRIDNDGNYCHENCRWATRLEQSNNRRTNVFIEYNGERKTMKEWATEYGMGVTTLLYRIKHGWDIERALTEPIKQQK